MKDQKLYFSGALNLDLIYEVDDLKGLEGILKSEILPGREYIITKDKAQRIKRQLREMGILRYKGGGGSAANTCTILARLGHRTAFLGTVGADEEGDIVLSSMKGVDLGDVKRHGITTECIILLLKGKRDRIILVAPGEDGPFPDVSPRAIPFLHLSSLPGEKGLDFQKKLVCALSPSSLLSMDPGEIYAQQGIRGIATILKRTDILFLTESELMMLDEAGDCERLMGALRSKPSRDTFRYRDLPIVVLKKGKEGATLYSDKESISKQPHGKCHLVDNTGAGDAFNAGFLNAFFTSSPLAQCLQEANSLAARSLGDWGRSWLVKVPSKEKKRNET